MCRDPAVAANHLSSGSLQGRRKKQGGKGQAGSRYTSSQGLPPLVLTQDVEFAQRAGLLEHQPGVHTVSVKLMFTGQHPEPLQGERQGFRPQRSSLQVGSLAPN